MIIQTERLIINKAAASTKDIDMYFRLWNHPQVMVNVGFPDGLGISKEEIHTLLNEWDDKKYIRCIVKRKHDQILIGECKLGEPDENGVCETDVKLFPEYWGNGYGKEIKRGLVDYLFAHKSKCLAVKADPKKSNIASIKMQEYVGGVIIERGKVYPIKNIEEYFPPEGHWLYMVFK